MTLLLDLRRFSLFPSLAQTGNGEPKKAHFLGKDKATPVERRQESGGRRDDEPKPEKTGPHRALNTIALGEVEDAYRYFQHQLVDSPNESWIARNYFCSLPLKRKGDGRPPAIFGRVQSSFPSEGHALNVEEVELHFPRKGGTDILHLSSSEISTTRPVASYCVGAACYLSPQEKDDFALSENSFASKGFTPVHPEGTLELLRMNAQNHAEFPWLYVVGSEWLSSVTGTVRERLREMVYWNKLVLNYHPPRHALQYRSLNEELGFNYGFSERVVLMPQTPAQALTKLEEGFAERFMRGM